MQGIERVLVLGLAAVLLAAPLPFGSVGRGATIALQIACCALGAVWVLWRVGRGLPATFGFPVIVRCRSVPCWA